MADHVWEHLHARFRDLCLQIYLVNATDSEKESG